jgi:hypothetical protein
VKIAGASCIVFKISGGKRIRGVTVMKDRSSQNKKAGWLLVGRFGFSKGRGVLLLLLVGGLLLSGGCSLQDVMQRSGLSGPGTSQVEDYQLSAEQSELVREIGYPESFILLFYEEEAVDGSLQIVRLETWDYYTEGESYTFVNGDLDSRDSLDVGALGSLAPLPYVPEQFAANMSRDDVLAASGVEDFIEVPLEKEYLEGGDLYYADSLAFGLVDGELRYLEALALVEE